MPLVSLVNCRDVSLFGLHLDANTLDAFASAVTATLKVFLIGAAGYLAVWRGWINDKVLSGMSALVANLTLPSMIFHRFALQFDPQTFPLWWVLALAGITPQLFGMALGWLVSRRVHPDRGRDEMVILIGYQNSGFFVLPMLQGILPPEQFDRAAVWLFVFVMFFNASSWPVCLRVLLKERGLDFKRLLLLPPTLWTIVALVIFGGFHDATQAWHHTMVWKALIGGESPGALQLIGDLTVPVATLILGGTIATTVQAGLKDFKNPGVWQVAWWKLMFLPLCCLAVIHFWPTPLFANDRILRLLIMLEFAAPPAINTAVFCSQFNYPTKLVPAACFVCYVLCMVTVPFWIALVL